MGRPSEIALSYIGMTEKPNNSGFTNEAFAKKMLQVGFITSHAWCSYFAELVFKEAYPEKFTQLDRLFSGSTLQTLRNFALSGYEIRITPEVDDLVIWQRQQGGVGMPTGHAGIVVSTEGDGWQFDSVEGNTNDRGEREGFIVAKKRRKVLAEVYTGLKVIGFVKP